MRFIWILPLYSENVCVLPLYRLFQIYLEHLPAGKCVRVKIGDKLGIFVEAAMRFAYNLKTYPPYHLRHQHWRPTAIKEAVVFESYVFPFALVMRAYIDTQGSAYGDAGDTFPNCPKGLGINSNVDVAVLTASTTTPTAGRPTRAWGNISPGTTVVATTTTTATSATVTTTTSNTLISITAYVCGFVLLIGIVTGLVACYCCRYGFGLINRYLLCTLCLYHQACSEVWGKQVPSYEVNLLTALTGLASRIC